MTAKLRCNGRPATLQEVPFCFEGMFFSLFQIFYRLDLSVRFPIADALLDFIFFEWGALG